MKYIPTTVVILVTAFFTSCNSCQKNSNEEDRFFINKEIPENVNESTRDLLQSVSSEKNEQRIDDLSENEEIQEKQKKLEGKRLQRIADEASRSAYWEMKDAEIKDLLKDSLNLYIATCDTGVFNRLAKTLNSDVVLKIFREKNPEFSRDFNRRTRKALADCKN